MNRTSLNFRGHVVIGGALECRTGLHIGGNRDSLVIGGLDLPVLRDSASRLPVISGSSLKGRLRGLLEMLRGAGPPADGIDAIGLLFGRRQMVEFDDGQRDVQRRPDNLMGLTVFDAKGGAKHFVTCDDLVEAALQHRQVEPPAEAHGDAQVVSRVLRLQAV